jgi:hypothetical protein
MFVGGLHFNLKFLHLSLKIEFLKKVLAYLFVTIFLFNSVGYFIAFKIEQCEIKTEVLSALNSGINLDGLAVLTISKTNLSKIEWLESGREMCYNGELYDIFKSSETETSVTYYCMDDSKETTLFSDLIEHVNTHVLSNTSHNNSKKTISHIVKLYFSDSKQLAYSTIENIRDFQTCNLIFSSTTLEKESPPPQLV